MPQKLLTKSLYLAGLQCQKLLWIKANDKSRIEEPSETKKLRFTQGYEVEALAKRLFKGAHDMSSENFISGITRTRQGVGNNKTLIEPAFLVQRLYARGDVLQPTQDGAWNLYEIKSSTRIKDVHIQDVSFQKYVCEQAGLTIKHTYLIHINNTYIYDGHTINPEQLFTITDITPAVNKASEGISERIARFLEMLDTTEPIVAIGAHCNSPYECDMKHECWAHVPHNSVFDLHNAQNACFELYAQGILKIEDIPLDFTLSPKQLIQKAAHIEATHHVNKEKLKEFFNRLTYPLFFFDIETINPGIPRFSGMRPYERIPFQYSLHVQDREGATPTQHTFLHKTHDDPREHFLKQLQKDLKDNGSVIVFNRHFEEAVIAACVAVFPEYEAWFESLKTRMVDLMEPFKNFTFYHPKQNGSTSIKNVLPVFSDTTYDNLSISSGDQANLYYEKAMHKECTVEEQERIFADLETYCAQDTLAEVTIITGLRDLIKD